LTDTSGMPGVNSFTPCYFLSAARSLELGPDDAESAMQSIPMKPVGSVQSYVSGQRLSSYSVHNHSVDGFYLHESLHSRSLQGVQESVEQSTGHYAVGEDYRRLSVGGCPVLTPINQGISLFLSHKQSNGQDTVLSLKMLLEKRLPDATFWLDTEQNPTATGMMDGVAECSHFLLFLTEGVTRSKWVQMEIRAAVENKKKIVLILETDSRHGAPDMATLISETPEEIRMIFEQNVAVPWYRDPAFREVSLDKICAMVHLAGSRAMNHNASMTSGVGHVLAYRNGEHLFDTSFVGLCAVGGVPLPGVSRLVRTWGIMTRMVMVLCGAVCSLQVLDPQGPSFLDIRDTVFNVLLHVTAYVATTITVAVVQSDAFDDLVSTRVNNMHLARQLRKWTRTCVKVVGPLYLLGIAIVHMSYTHTFFHSFYLESESPFSKYFHIVNGIMWGIAAFPFAIQLMASISCFFVIVYTQVMDLTTAFNVLHAQIAELGLQHAASEGIVIDTDDSSVLRFQCCYVDAWQRTNRVNYQLQPLWCLLWLTWIVNFLLQCWRLLSQQRWPSDLNAQISLDQQFSDMPISSYLTVRTILPLFLEAALFVPFVGTFLLKQVREWAEQLVFRKASMRLSAIAGVQDLDLHYPVGPFKADATLLRYVILLVTIRISLWCYELSRYHFR